MIHFTEQFRQGRIVESARSTIVSLKYHEALSFSSIAAGKALFPCIGVFSLSSGTFRFNFRALLPPLIASLYAL